MPAIFQTKNLIDTQSHHPSKPVFALDQIAAGKRVLDLESQPQEPPACEPASKISTCIISLIAVSLMLLFTLIAIELVDTEARSCNSGQPLDEFVIINEIDPEYVSLPISSQSSYNQALMRGASQEALI